MKLDHNDHPVLVIRIYIKVLDPEGRGQLVQIFQTNFSESTGQISMKLGHNDQPADQNFCSTVEHGQIVLDLYTTSPEPNTIYTLPRREVCQKVKTGSLNTSSACASQQFRHNRNSTCIPVLEECKSCWAL